MGQTSTPRWKLLFSSDSLALIHRSVGLSPTNLTTVRAYLPARLPSPFGCDFCTVRGPRARPQNNFPTAALRLDAQHKVQGEYSELLHIDARIDGRRLGRLLIYSPFVA